MESYTDFAALYDTFMEEVPYDAWCDNITGILKKHGITDGLVCELGAGTGEMTMRLRDKGFDMIGIDSSSAMLQVAREKNGFKDDILYLMQDMREFELYGTVRAIVSVCDSINYVTDTDDLVKVFRLCNNYLDPSGILVFDFNTAHKYRDVIGDSVIAENDDGASFIWENFWDEETHINEYDVTFFTELENGLYRKFTEEHYQRGYTVSEMKEAVEKSGMIFVGALDTETLKAADENSERVYIIAKEQGKK